MTWMMLRATKLLVPVRRISPSMYRGFMDRKRTKFSVDRTGLINFQEEEAIPSVGPVVREPLSPLGKDLQSYIRLKGPITLHDYMSQSLNHLLHGYYQGKGEVIGKDGDFITAPEVSQLFGEMIGIWCLSMWEQMGRPAKLNLVELGPGKGTLMKDMLRTAGRFPGFREAVSVHLVELSTVLRGRQYEALNCASDTATFTATETTAGPIRIKDGAAYTTKEAVTVHWHSFLHQVPSDAPVLIIGQEFLDAFPVHQFCYTDKGWREKLIDVNSTSGSTAGPASKKPQVITTNPRIAAAKKEVLSRHTAGGEGAVEAPTESNKEAKIEAVGTPAPEFHFRFVLSPSPTPAVRSLLMNTKPTVAAAAAGVSTSGASTSAEGSIDAKEGGADHISSNPDDHSVVSASTVVAAPQVGDGLEVSPLAIATCEDAAARVVKCGGAALFIDYGEDHTQEDSLRAFYRHKQVSVLSQPGLADVTADVDFAMCRRAALRKGAAVPPLLTQGDFLMRMGIVSRVEQLIELEQTSDEAANALVRSLKYLVEPGQMGSRFKVLSIASPVLDKVTGFTL